VRNKLSVPDRMLLLIGFRVLEGFPTVVEDDVYTFFEHRISDARAGNILTDLYLRKDLHRKRKEREKDEETKKTRRGPRGFVYNISMKGINRYNDLVEKGYRIWENQPMRQWDEENIEWYQSLGYISRAGSRRRRSVFP
jgi:hypothetical protein